jgi:DNA-binding GntR family transcriptional regulator
LTDEQTEADNRLQATAFFFGNGLWQQSGSMSKSPSNLGQPRLRERKRDSVTSAFVRLRDLIVEGQIAPGSWVVEAEMAERLGMSRTPVRGALQLLQREGFIVEQRGGKKSRLHISPLTKEDANELYMIVCNIETLAGSLTASLGTDRRKALCRVLVGLNEKLSAIAAAKKVDYRSVFELDTRFHHEVVSASAGPRLMVLHNMMKPQIERYWRLYAHTIIQDLRHSVAEHGEIIAAIAEGDVKGTERALAANWKHGAERIDRLINLFGERGSW